MGIHANFAYTVKTALAGPIYEINKVPPPPSTSSTVYLLHLLPPPPSISSTFGPTKLMPDLKKVEEEVSESMRSIRSTGSTGRPWYHEKPPLLVQSRFWEPALATQRLPLPLVRNLEPSCVLRDATVSFFLPQLDGHQDTISLAVRFPRRRDPNETTNECVDKKGTLFRRWAELKCDCR